MKKALFGTLLACLFAASASAQDIAPSVLTPPDIERYRAIFAAQETGDLTKSDALVAELADPVLLGYVQHQRYLGSHYVTKFQELTNWMDSYADLYGAERIYSLALRKKPGGARSPRAADRAPWRGERFDEEATNYAPTSTNRGKRILDQLQDFARADNPAGAERAVADQRPSGDLPQEDVDSLYSYVASAYLAEALDADALRISESEIARGSSRSLHLHWTAGLAAYRMGDLHSAAVHFSAMANDETGSPRDSATSAFWAARTHMRANDPERVVELYEHAAESPYTFYGTLASRVMGRDLGITFEEPVLDTYAYERIVENTAARRAIALWQIGRMEAVQPELARAFGELSPSLDPAFAALARMLGAPELELRAAETSAVRGIYLTSLYPVPPYEPEGGYRLDQAIVLAVARQESRFIPDAVSGAGARGLMQIMPQTAVYITKDPSMARTNRDRLNDPAYSMRLGEDYLLDLLQRQNGNLLGLTAAYNAGLGNLSRWVARQEGNDDPVLFIESLPSAETRHYVKRVMMNIWMYQQRFGTQPTGMDDAAAGEWPVFPFYQAIAAAFE